MGNTFTKLFESILDSTVWQEALPTKVVWITMLAMADRDGRVWASVPGLAKRAGVKLEEGEAALKKFLSPDKYSRSQEEGGRRVKEIDGGWELVNHRKYREMLSVEERREYQRVKQAEYRAKKKGSSGVLGRGQELPGEGEYGRAEGDAKLQDEIVTRHLPKTRVRPQPEPEIDGEPPMDGRDPEAEEPFEGS